MKIKISSQQQETSHPLTDSGEGPFYFQTKRRLKGPKKDFFETGPPIWRSGSAAASYEQALVCDGRTQNHLWRGSKPRHFAPLRLELEDSTIWMKWLIVVVKIAKLISMHSIRLATRASKFANRTPLSTILSLRVFTFKTGPKFMTWLT